MESDSTADWDTAAELAAHLCCDEHASALSGAELVVGRGWFGLRSHPAARATVSYGGPEIPRWLDEVLSETVLGANSWCQAPQPAGRDRSGS